MVAGAASRRPRGRRRLGYCAARHSPRAGAPLRVHAWHGDKGGLGPFHPRACQWGAADVRRVSSRAGGRGHLPRAWPARRVPHIGFELFRQGHCTTSGLYLRWKGLKNTLWQQRLILHVITCYFVTTLSPPSYLARFGMCTMTHNSTCMHPTDGSSVSTSFLGCMQMLIYMLAVASGSSSTCTNVAGPGWSYINALQYAHHRVQSVTSS